MLLVVAPDPQCLLQPCTEFLLELLALADQYLVSNLCRYRGELSPFLV